MLITLMTDFGLQDPYVGIMKGVIFGINPQVEIIDLTHDIPAQDIMAGALTLQHSKAYFPAGTIHVAVIDPGVGSSRRPVLVKHDGSFFIGPDNGVLSLAIDRKPDYIAHLSSPAFQLQPTSATFHGRDIFAPAAAHVSLGVPPCAFGEKLENLIPLRVSQPLRTRTEIVGEIIYVDHFGNLFTNIAEHDLTGLADASFDVVLGVIRLSGIASNYTAPANSDGLIAIINSWGLLEIALCLGNAQERTGARIGDPVKIEIANGGRRREA